MNEQRLRLFLRRIDDAPPPRMPEAAQVLALARRRLFLGRALVGAAAALVIGGVALAATRIDRDVRPVPPSGGYSERCAPADPIEPGPLGAVAAFTNGELNIAHDGDVRKLAEFGPDAEARTPVRVSPDGRWVSFGPGLFVAAEGGEPCAPTPDVGTVAWAPDGAFVATTLEGGLVAGRPDEGVRTLLPSGWGATSLALDPSGTKAAVGRFVRRGAVVATSEVHVIDVVTGSSRRIVSYQADQAIQPRVAQWSPDGTTVLFWEDLGPSLSADGGPLMAVPESGGAPVEVIEGMLLSPAQIASCGESIVLSGGVGREIETGKRLYVAGPGDWRARPLDNAPEGSAFWPSCSPDGSMVAATVVAGEAGARFGTASRSIAVFALDGSAEERIDDSEYSYEFGRWSTRHAAEDEVLLFVRRVPEPQGPAEVFLQVSAGDGSDELRRILPLGRVDSVYGDYGYQRSIDWYQP